MEAGLKDLAGLFKVLKVSHRQEKYTVDERQTAIEMPFQQEDKHATRGFSLHLNSSTK